MAAETPMQEQQPAPESDPTGATAKNQPEETYQERCRRFAAQRDLYHCRSFWNANVNVALVLAALACLGLGFWIGGVPLFLVAGLLFLAFVAAYIHLGRLDRLEQRYQTLWQINQEGLLRRQRDWAHLPLRQPAAGDSQHPYAADLDLLGHASLQHLLSTANTPVGQTTLQGWLLQPAAPAEIAARQRAAAELAPVNDFRDHLALSGRLMGKSQPSYERFLQWAEGDSWLAQHPWLIWSARLLAVLTLLFVGLQASGLVPYSLWIFPLAINLALLGAYGRQVHKVLEEVEERQEVLRSYADLFRQITSQRFTATRLQALQARLSAGGISADQQMRRLARLMPLITIRRSMFFFLIDWLTLWDFHVLWLLERWQRKAGRSARAWLEALGEMEALAALATLAHDHPAWAFPELVEDRSIVLEATHLGHPLLPPASCVQNDVTLGPPGSFLLVTGSNMSGKSTLLRSLGVNIVLAQAGGPVCASRLRLAPLALATSIRVQDSLEQGVSYFMAELKRIKAAVDLVEQAQARGERQPVFLLDEILHGTNTAERQIAVRQIVRHLLALGATGAISTHDLSLADVPELAQASQPVHFSERFIEGSNGLEMRFDYHLRPGIATSTNALQLLKMVGL
jgi:predicted ATPase